LQQKKAFARVAEFARPNEDPATRFAAYFARCVGSFFRGEFPLAQEIAKTYLRQAEADGRDTEAGTARRLLALVLFYQGDLKAARSFYEHALADFVRGRAKTQRIFANNRAERNFSRFCRFQAV
jgi:hypothetical protein